MVNCNIVVVIVSCMLAAARGFSPALLRAEGRPAMPNKASFNARHATAAMGAAAILLTGVSLAPLNADASILHTVSQVNAGQAVTTSGKDDDSP
jgi:hypothetical protein